MPNSNSGKDVVRAHRKPMVASARKREKVQKTDDGSTLMMKREEIVIRRQASPQVNQAPQAVSMNNIQQLNQTRSMNQMQGMNQMQATVSQTQALDQGQNEKMQRNDSQMGQDKRIQNVNVRMSQRKAAMNMRQTMRPTSQELKQQAISQALTKTAKTMPLPKKKKTKGTGIHFGFKRILLATACAAVAVFAIVFFVNLNAPNISLRVAAIQSGIEASYPAYVPRDYSISDITSENGKISLSFRNSSTGDAFSLIEEKSSWDSNALLNNFVKPTYGDNYTLVREQGLTLYISGSDASWVNGGVIYKIKTLSGSLNKKQIKSIAVSL